MKITVVLPCHNQQEIIKLCIEQLKNQTIPPNNILVIDDHSTGELIESSDIVSTVSLDKIGRVHNRNRGISEALAMESDIIFFMDGDSIPENNTYIEHYLNFNLAQPTMIFGTRKHIPRPVNMADFNYDFNYESTVIKKYPSDLLTANLDKLTDFDNTDLRTVSGITDRINDIRDFDEKAFMITSGMVTWSCNFMINKIAANVLKDFMKEIYGIDGWFDYTQFGHSWGGEDNAFGLDAHFAGINILMNDKSKILHFMHDRSDQLNTHVRLNHIMMSRYKRLLNIKNI